MHRAFALWLLLGACSAERATPPDAAAPLDAATSEHDASARVDASGTAGSDAAIDAAPTDAAAPDATALECRDALPLRCGDRLRHSTDRHGQPNQWSGYACSARGESGPETVYAFRSDEHCRVSVRMSELEEDLDLFVLAGCDAWSACLDQAPAPLDLQRIEAVSFDAAPQRDYIVSVDGYDETSGSYALAVDCFCGEAGASLGEGEWLLQVDRRWNGDASSVSGPVTELLESDYAPVDDGASHSVRFIGELHTVSIGSAPIIGEPMIVQPNRSTLSYELTMGTFAGGHFLVWVQGESLQAELTLYGSGVPITSSERGQLVRMP